MKSCTTCGKPAVWGKLVPRGPYKNAPVDQPFLQCNSCLKKLEYAFPKISKTFEKIGGE